ncbi:MAG: threonine ammonia-lyase [Geminicoccaceae bacterium]
MSVTPDDVAAARGRIAGQLAATPCLHSRTLSEITGAELWLKFENLQYTASFKERGALNRLMQLTPEQAAAGVIAMSAGNHAQGVAHHARRLGIPATIVMPRHTPFVKVENTRRFGARVLLDGEGVEDAARHARAIAAAEGLTFVHPFDDPAVIAGQGTLALEMLEAAPDLEVLVVPVGGGGLIGGMAIAARALRPGIEIVGVEAALYPSVYRRLHGLPALAGGPTIAEGIAVKEPGDLTYPLIEALVSELLLVEEAAIEAAVLQLLEIEKTVAEGAGAAGLAAVTGHPDRFRGRKVGLVLSGGNIDSRLLSAVILRGLVRTQRLVRLRVGVPDTPGSLVRIASIIAERGGNVVDVDHQRAFSKLSVKQADVDFTVETRTAEHAAEIAAALQAADFPVIRLDDRSEL